MRNTLILVTFFIINQSVYSQDMRCFTSGADTNTKTISALTSCGKYFWGSVDGVVSYTDTYNCGSGNQWIGGESIFYFKDVVKGRYTFKIEGFATDLDLFILSGCDENMCLTSKGSQGSSGVEESVSIDLEDGENVYIVIDGKFVSSADFSLKITCEGFCDDLRSISCGSARKHSNYSYSSSNDINSHLDCGEGSYSQPDVGYSVKTFGNSPITIDLVPHHSIDLDLFVYDDCGGKLSNCLGKSASSPWGESVYLASGGSGDYIYPVVDGKSQSGNYDIAVTCGSPCDTRPIKIGCNALIHSTTKGKSNNASYYSSDPYGNKGQNWGPEEVYEINLDDTYEMDIRLDIHGSEDLNLYLLESHCDPGSCIRGSKRNYGGGVEQIKETLSKGRYYIVVEGYRGASSDFTLSLTGCGCIIENVLVCGEPMEGTLKNGTNNFTTLDGDCFTYKLDLPSEDLIYSFIAKEDGYYSFMLYGMDHAMDLFLTDDCKDPTHCLGGSTRIGINTDIVNIQMNKGEQVFALVDGLIDARNSDFFIEVICADEDMGPGEDDPSDEDEPSEDIIPTLGCGETFNGTTEEKKSVYRKGDYTCFISSLDFNGGEELVRFQKEDDDDVLVVHMFHGQKSLENLSMFIMDSTMNEVENCKGLNFRGDKTLGNGSVIGEYFTDKDNLLPAGTYYAVLDGYNSRVASDFTLTTSCSFIDCDSIVGLPCGESLVAESTENSFNGESMYYGDQEIYVGYTGGENIYSFCLDSAASIDVDIYGLKAIDGYSADLDVFLVENICSDDKRVVASSRNRGAEDENLSVDLKAGEYYIIVDGWNGARATFSFRNDVCYAADCGKSKKLRVYSKNLETEGAFQVYPNPFTNQIKLSYDPVNEDNYLISLYNISGELLISEKSIGGNIDISDWFESESSGVFYLQIMDGSIVRGQKLIKM